MKHVDAFVIARGLVERLRPACTRIEIAGSVRRGKAEPKDIEIVAIPDLTPLPPPRAMFGQPRPQWHKIMLDKLLFELCLEGWMRPEKNGEKYKKLVVDPQQFGVDGDSYGGSTNLIHPVYLDLFLVTPPAEWGVQMVIRTGPGTKDNNFSMWCVTQKAKGGALPDGYHVNGGAIWKDNAMGSDEALSMPEEVDFLNFLGLGWIEPGEREARWKR